MISRCSGDSKATSQSPDVLNREGAHDTKVLFEASLRDRVVLPVRSILEAPNTDERRACPEPPLIVIVDDDAAVRRAIASVVESAGFASASFTSAEDCLRSGLAECARLILDVRMPGMNGLQLQDAIFDAFFTTKPQGTGMGLRISRPIIESHGGRLWASTGAAEGATFHFSLPADSRKRGTAMS